MSGSLLPTISEVRGAHGDPAPNWRWTVVLPTDVYSNLESSLASSSGGFSFDSSGYLTTPVVPFGRVESIQLPGLSIDADGRFGAAAKTHYPRWLEVEGCQLSMYEDMNYNSLMYFISWRNLVVDPYHNYNSSSVYKRTVYFMAFDPVSSDSPTLIVELQGAWPTNAGQGLSYEYTASGMVILPVNLSIDNVLYHFNQNVDQLNTQDV